MLVRLLLATIALIGMTAFAPVPLPKPPKVTQKTLLESMQGDWQMVSTERNLRGGRFTSRSTTRIRIEDNRWSYVYPNGTEFRVSTTYNIVLDLHQKLATMDLKRALPGGGETVYMSGIVVVEGDTLKFCYSLAINPYGTRMRPTTLDPLPENAILMTLKRIGGPAKPEKKRGEK